MKALIVSLLMVTSVFAANVEEAKSLYSSRESTGEGLSKALEAATMYEDLAKNETDSKAKAELLIEASRSYYFYANHLTDNDKKEALHGTAKNIATAAIDLAQQLQDIDLEARATYQFGANLGKWAEARGIGSSLGEWPHLRDSMEKIIKDLKKPEVESAGALRILGRAYFKLPGLLGGSTKKSLQYLSKANQMTLIPEAGISSNPSNIVYLAETMIEENQITLGKALLHKFIDYVEANGAEKYNPKLIPETKDEVINAQNILNRF